MNYSIKINHELKIIYYKHGGVIELKEIEKALCELLKLDEFTKNGYNILTDYSGGTFNFTIDDIEQINSNLHEFRHILKNKKSAVIVDSPNEYVITYLFCSNTNNDYNAIFSTEEAALKYLMNPLYAKTKD